MGVGAALPFQVQRLAARAQPQPNRHIRERWGQTVDVILRIAVVAHKQLGVVRAAAAHQTL
eukprot:44073-Eustigmatos_ZCMA.PRE.1